MGCLGGVPVHHGQVWDLGLWVMMAEKSLHTFTLYIVPWLPWCQKQLIAPNEETDSTTTHTHTHLRTVCRAPR